MKQTHKLLAVVLSVIMILSVVTVIPFSAFAETDGIFTYSISDGKATITGLVDENTAGAIEIPSTIGGYPVTKIGQNAFCYYSRLTSITIPDLVTSIGSHAFFCCTGLTSITIPDSVTSIGDYAFYGCTGLESIAVDSGNKYYHSAGNCLIETASKTLIKGCNNSVIPNDGIVTLIDAYAFDGCLGLTSITIPNSVTSIGGYAFYGCTGLTSITIPDSVTSIGDYAFYWCTGLTSITIPDSVTSIGGYAFYGCTGLTSITIPDSVTSIGDDAFYGCSGLESIAVDSGNKYYHSAGNCLIKTASKTLIKGCNNSVIPNDGSVTLIGSGAFYGCLGLTSITIPNSVTSIGYAFYGCTGLESIAVDSGNKYYHSAGNCLIETASKTLIKGCNNSVIPNDGSVTSIGKYAFDGCLGLTSITLPNSVTSIGDYAFYGCSELTDVYYTGTEQQKTNIVISYGNDCLLNATWHYNYASSHKAGDISGDGSLNNGDLVLLFQYLSGWDVADQINKSAVDLNGDGKENNQDLVLLFQFLSGWEVEIF